MLSVFTPFPSVPVVGQRLSSWRWIHPQWQFPMPSGFIEFRKAEIIMVCSEHAPSRYLFVETWNLESFPGHIQGPVIVPNRVERI